MVTVWIPLVPAHQKNGGLVLNPGGHTKGLMQHWIDRGVSIRPSELPRNSMKEYRVDMSPGDVLFMSKYCPHRSLKNISKTVRWSMDIRYQMEGTPSARPFFPTFTVGDPKLTYKLWKETWKAAVSNYKGQAIHRWTERRKPRRKNTNNTAKRTE
mmetsp:Transcript_325/g.855  ORF Transcript_325/g.855 Transcript_325/m.855 type:complete len:155 (-) Transcript_325:368-832(-)